jgi:CheY-like chemotaxis protein
MTKTALIVDDNRALAEDLAEILEAEGYRTRIFDDPELVLRAEPDLHFDVALLDVRMPGMDGVTLQRLLMQRHPEARFVLMTAYADDQRIAQGLAAGACALLMITGLDPEEPARLAGGGTMVIVKPFSPETLLRALLELRRAHA